MKNMKKLLVIFFAALMLMVSIPVTASAEDANVIYSGNSGKIIFEPGSEYSPSDLFPNFKNVMPGAVLHQKITIKSNADKDVKVKLFLRSLGAEGEEDIAFLSKLTLKIDAEESPLFDANADETAGLTDWVLLGTLYYGADIDLDLTLSVPNTLDNSYQDLIGRIRWQFATEEFPLSKPAWQCPNNKNHSYHIEEIYGVSTFVCDECDKQEPMKCEVCGGKMRKVMAISIGGADYIAYKDGDMNYKTASGDANFFFLDNGIIDYYILNGERIDIKDVNEYVLYTYHECIENHEHHTDPQPPDTGDDLKLGIWITAMAISGLILIIIIVLLLINKKKKNRLKEGAKC